MLKRLKLSLFLSILILATGLRLVSAQDAPAPVVLTLAGYAVPREAYGDIIPLFQDYWQEQTGQQVLFQESYLASGAQSRAVIGGFEADIVALSLEDHVTRIANAGLITHDWQDNGYNGMVTSSLVVLAVRPGNPRGIEDWEDIAQPGIEVITPDPATSGAAQWNVMGAYGAAYRGFVEGYEAGEAGALQFITDVFTNVSVLDSDGRESFLTFERGIGDVAITYENEFYAGIIGGAEIDVVYPSSTIVIENPIALIDTYVDKHGTREVAEAFLQFVYTPEAQAAYAAHGFRPPVERIAAEEEGGEVQFEYIAELDAEKFPSIEDPFLIDAFGGWPEVVPAYFSEEGIYTKMIAEVKGQ